MKKLNLSPEKQLWDILELIGERLQGNFHIIDNSDRSHRKKWRVYHNGGYCFDVTAKEIEIFEEEHKPYWEYEFNAEWPEFAVLDVNCALNLMQECLEEVRQLGK